MPNAVDAAINDALRLLNSIAFSANCDNTFAGLGLTANQIVSHLSDVAKIVDGTSSTQLVSSLYNPIAARTLESMPATKGVTIGQKLAGSSTTQVYALASSNGSHEIFVNGYLFAATGSTRDDAAILMHEALHNLTGEGDDVLQQKMGLPVTPGDSSNIGKEIGANCL